MIYNILLFILINQNKIIYKLEPNRNWNYVEIGLETENENYIWFGSGSKTYKTRTALESDQPEPFTQNKA